MTFAQKSKHLFITFLLTVFAGEVYAAPGDPDITFNPGTDNAVYGVAVQPDNKIIIVGYFDAVNGVPMRRIARLNTDGSLDNSFNPGNSIDNYYIKTTALQADGKIIIGGDFTSYNGVSRNNIARLNPDGSLDNSFNPGSGVNDYVESLVIQPDNKIIIGGYFTTVNGVSMNCIARLNSDGSLDSSFNPGSGVTGGMMYTFVQAIALQGDGKIIIGGEFTAVNGVSSKYIARLNADGSVDSGFNPVPGDDIYTISLQPDGKVIIASPSFTSVNGIARMHIARLNTDGSLDLGFDSGISDNNHILTSAIQADGKVLVGGFTVTGGDSSVYFSRLNIDGTVDATFNAVAGSIGSSIEIITLQPNGKVIMGGNFTTVNGISHNYIARLNSDSKKNDYNNDAIAGWLWKGDSNGVETHSEIWQLTFPLYSDNWGIPTRSYPPIFSDQANWEVMTTGDFNNDGDTDILWRNKTTNDWKIWQMQNGLRVGQTNWVDTFDPTHQWQVIGAGDTDKDGDDDIILNNTSTGEVMIWEVQNHAVVATHLLSTTKPSYVVNRIGDFNKDGDVDLMLSEVGGSNLVIWEIENNAFVQEHTFPTNATGWDLKCAGDFDHDGDDDILLINSSTQQEKWFEIENYGRIAQHVGATNVGFVLLGCGDYDGDGDMDMLWQRSADDMNRVVLQQNWGATKQTVYTNPYGGVNPGAAGYGYIYRGNSN